MTAMIFDEYIKLARSVLFISIYDCGKEGNRKKQGGSSVEFTSMQAFGRDDNVFVFSVNLTIQLLTRRILERHIFASPKCLVFLTYVKRILRQEVNQLQGFVSPHPGYSRRKNLSIPKTAPSVPLCQSFIIIHLQSRHTHPSVSINRMKLLPDTLISLLRSTRIILTSRSTALLPTPRKHKIGLPKHHSPIRVNPLNTNGPGWSFQLTRCINRHFPSNTNPDPPAFPITPLYLHHRFEWTAHAKPVFLRHGFLLTPP